MRTAIIDIETPFIPDNGTAMDVDRIFCIGVKVDSEPIKLFTHLYHPMASGNLRTALNLINSCELAVFHNGIRFDVPIIERLIGPIVPRIHDTLLISKLMYTRDQLLAMDPGVPSLPSSYYGSYALKAFGHRLGCHKGDFEDFSKLTTEMLVYLEQDVLLTHRLYTHLLKQHNFPLPHVIDLENEFARICFEQELFGFYFDIDSARTLYTKLMFEKGTIERRLQRTFKPMFLPDGPPKQTKSTIKRRLYLPDPSYDTRW